MTADRRPLPLAVSHSTFDTRHSTLKTDLLDFPGAFDDAVDESVGRGVIGIQRAALVEILRDRIRRPVGLVRE